ncbi:hypothetical protein LMJ53_13170, partial [Rheinheimera sp. UJ51]|uniref:hypothetical protein n=1 Tax=Rheinheimera sp. UJ51 TaxID=2892446 RepID=UPI001E5A60B5
KLAGRYRNRWPDEAEISGRMIPKWVADSCRNRWPDHPEIRTDKDSIILETSKAHNLKTFKTVEPNVSHQQSQDDTESCNTLVTSQVKKQQYENKLESRNPVVGQQNNNPKSNYILNPNKIAELKGSIQQSDIRVESNHVVAEPKVLIQPSNNGLARRGEVLERKSHIQPSSNGLARRSEVVEPKSQIQPFSNRLARRSEVVEPKSQIQPSSNGLARRSEVLELKGHIQPSSNGLARRSEVVEPKSHIQPSSNGLAMRSEVVEPKGHIQPSSNGLAMRSEVVEPKVHIQPSSNGIESPEKLIEPTGCIQTSSSVMKNAESLKRFILSLPLGTHPVPDAKYIKIRKGKGVTVVLLVVKNKPLNHSRILEKYKHSDALDNQIFENILNLYNFFLEQYRSGRLFEQINWKPHDNKVRIRTMRQLLEFHLINGNWRQPGTKQKLERMIKKYSLGKNGEVDLRYTSNDELMALFIDKAANGEAPSDRDELLKRIKAAYNFAKNHQNVEKLEFFMPLEVVKRNLGTPKTIIRLSVYIRFFIKAVELQQFDLAMFMLCQETLFTRMQNTIELCKSDINFDECFIRILGHKHKNGKNGFYYFPPGLISLFKAFTVYRMKRTKSSNPCLFPSLTNTAKCKANFGKELTLVREAIISDLKQSDGDDAVREEVREVRAFIFHDLRGLNNSLLKEINVREGEASNAFNRYVGAVELAYNDLSDRNQRMFKNKKLKYISDKHPEYKLAIDHLEAHFSSDEQPTAE